MCSLWNGPQDFRYEFSYRVGNGSRRTLYRGTDAQYYFALPAGEPGDGYQGESPAICAQAALPSLSLVSQN